MLGHFGELPDLERWRFMRHILQEFPQPPPQEAFWRCREFKNFAWRPGCAWHSVREEGGAAIVETSLGSFAFDFIIFATGTETNLSARPELTPIVDQIALWRDRFTPPRGEESEELGRYPYLGSAFEFTERKPRTAQFLSRLHNFTYGAMPSHGLTGAAIVGLKYGVPRLVRGLVRDLFQEDRAEYFRDLQNFAVPELETLDSQFEWIKERRKLLVEEATTVVERGLTSLTAAKSEGSSKETKNSARRWKARGS
jgi:cation diffusion facilitator CzcD-associated flavoprotein CzcO